MAALAVALFSTIGTTTATAGAAATGATAAAAAGGSSLALTLLQGAATVGSALASFSAGSAKAQDIGFEAGQEELASRQRALEIRRDLSKKIGATRVAFAGSGLDISSAGAIEDSLTSDARFATDIERENATARKAAASLRARSARRSGYTSGLLSIADYGVDVLRRG